MARWNVRAAAFVRCGLLERPARNASRCFAVCLSPRGGSPLLPAGRIVEPAVEEPSATCPASTGRAPRPRRSVRPAVASRRLPPGKTAHPCRNSRCADRQSPRRPSPDRRFGRPRIRRDALHLAGWGTPFPRPAAGSPVGVWRNVYPLRGEGRVRIRSTWLASIIRCRRRRPQAAKIEALGGQLDLQTGQDFRVEGASPCQDPEESAVG